MSSLEGRSLSPLAQQAIAGLRAEFQSYDHRPTEQMWASLSEAAEVFARMADRSLERAVYVSSLDVGVGKTSLLKQCIRALVASPDHLEVAALVCMERLEQIGRVAREMGLSESDYAVLTSDHEHLNKLGLGAGEARRARVLFTTQRMVEVRSDGRRFADVAAFHHRGHVRPVLLWDERIRPGHGIAFSRDRIATLYEPLRRRHEGLVKALEGLFGGLEHVATGQVVVLDDFVQATGVGLATALRTVEDHGDEAQTMRDLWFLSGRTVTLRREQGKTLLVDFRETLPADFGPALVFDASARVSAMYRLWAKHRGGVVMLSPASKQYDGLTIHLWDHAGGKDAFVEGAAHFEAIAKTIDSKPDEAWFIVTHKALRDLPDRVRKLVTTDTSAERLRFTHYGRHDASNEYKDVPNVVAVLKFFAPSQYEALTRLVCGTPASDGDVPDPALDAVKYGEVMQALLQAVGRIRVRGCIDGRCPDTHAYVIASSKTGVTIKMLKETFPGAKVVRWQPVPKDLKGRVKQALDYIVARLEAAPDAHVRFTEVRAHLGMKDRSNFNSDIRGHADFGAALSEKDIVEWGAGRWPTGFKRMSAVYGFSAIEDVNEE